MSFCQFAPAKHYLNKNTNQKENFRWVYPTETNKKGDIQPKQTKKGYPTETNKKLILTAK
jgi:hypothetical protein